MKISNHKFNKLMHGPHALEIGILLIAVFFSSFIVHSPATVAKSLVGLIIGGAIVLFLKIDMAIPFLLILPLFRLRFHFADVEIETHEILLVLLFFTTFLRGVKERELYPVSKIFMLYVGILLFSSLINKVDLFEFKGTYLHAVIFPFMIYYTLVNVKDLKWMKKLIFPCLAFSAIIFLIFNIYYGRGIVGLGHRLVPVTSDNPLYLGQLFGYLQMLVILFGLPLFFSGNSGRRYLLLFVILIATFGLMVSGTRGAIIGALIGALIEFKIYKKIKKGLIFCAVIILLSISTPMNLRIPVTGTPANIFTIVTRGQGDDFMSGFFIDQKRIPYWKVAYSIFKEKPLLGHGLQEYGYLSSESIMWYIVELPWTPVRISEVTEDFPHPHSLYLLLMVAGGIIVLPFFLLFCFNLLRRGINSYRKTYDLGLKLILLSALTSLFVFLIVGIFDIPFFSGGEHGFIIWFFVGLIDRISRSANSVKEVKV